MQLWNVSAKILTLLVQTHQPALEGPLTLLVARGSYQVPPEGSDIWDLLGETCKNLANNMRTLIYLPMSEFNSGRAHVSTMAFLQGRKGLKFPMVAEIVRVKFKGGEVKGGQNIIEDSLFLPFSSSMK